MKQKMPKMPKIYCIKHNHNSNILYDYITYIDTYTYKINICQHLSTFVNKIKRQYLLLPINKYFYAEK